MSGNGRKRLKIIFDSNVIINAEEGNKFDDILLLDHDFFLSEETLERELYSRKTRLTQKISENSLHLSKATKEIYDKQDYLSQKYGDGPSFCDKMALATAIIEKFNHITTADAQLRRASEKEGVPPLYILDLIGFLLEEGKLTKDEAQKFYDDVFPRRKSTFEKMIQEQLSA